MKNIMISFTPKEVDLDEIKNWLTEEYQTNGNGFLCNWSSIADAYKNQRLLIAYHDHKPVGFITWFGTGRNVELQIAEVKPQKRGKGIGRKMLIALSDELVSRGVYVVDLHCQPSDSEPIWRNLGFVAFPDVKDFEWENKEHDRHLYKILVPYLEPEENISSGSRLSLWAAEPFMSKSELPKWEWKIESPSRELPLPIISPAKRDWNIAYFNSQGMVKENKIKYFSNTEIDFGNFMIITSL